MEKKYNYKIIQFLNEDLVQRKLVNSRYSLRGFGKFLDIDPSFLLKLLNGHAPLSHSLLEKICKCYDYTSDQKDEFFSDFLEQSKYIKREYCGNVKIKKLTLDQFKETREWYYAVIVEMTRLSNFSSDPKWIADKLKISEEKVQEAIGRLIEIGQLEITKDNKLVSAYDYVEISCPTTHESTFDYLAAPDYRLKEFVKRSGENLDSEIRSASHNVMATITVDSTLINYAKERMDDFLKELCTELEKKSKNKDQVVEVLLFMHPFITN